MNKPVKKHKGAPALVTKQSASDCLNIANELDQAIKFADGIELAVHGVMAISGDSELSAPVAFLAGDHADNLRDIRKRFQELWEVLRIEDGLEVRP